MTVIHGGVKSWPGSTVDHQECQTHRLSIFGTIASDVLQEDAILGKEVLTAFSVWMEHTHTYKNKSPISFASMDDYLIYRFKDVAIQFIIALVKFSSNAHVPASETYLLRNRIRLFH
ncbi:hypothetical protein N7507_007289 [Penicillium longicatenatum]|nr:hypothetical protein N7507_007289 [Penicillium longicatenatum]